MAPPVRAHLIQADTAWEDKRENFARVSRMLSDARPAPGDLVVLPEMFDTGFSFNIESTADTDLLTLNYLKQTAQRHRVTLQGARTVIAPGGRGLNRATIVGPDGSILCEYDKIHPFSYGKEPRHFVGGERVMTYPWGDTAVCPSICYDLRFPELYRKGMLMGAEVFALGANWPVPRKVHRRALGIARAIENQGYVFCVNRAGSDPQSAGGLVYEGGSYAVDHMGTVVAEAGSEACVLSVEVDLGALREWRRIFPAWKDARLID